MYTVYALFYYYFIYTSFQSKQRLEGLNNLKQTPTFTDSEFDQS